MANLLIVAEAYLPRVGGGVRYEVELVNFFRAAGHTVDVLTVGETTRTTREEEEGGAVIRLGKHFQFDSARLSATILPFFIKHLPRYHLVHFNAPNPLGELGFRVARMLGRVPTHSVCFYHGEVVSEKPFARLYNDGLLSSHFEACDRVLVSSPNFANTSELLQEISEKVSVIPFGIDTHLFSPATDWQLRMNQRRSLHLIFAGRLAPQKGLHILLEGLTQSQCTLNIVGDGPLLPELQATVRRMKLDARVSFQGEIREDDKLIELYRQADVVVLPSTTRSESFGYALAEGMACGTSAISTELGTGTSFINVHGETGLVVNPDDSDALAEALIYLSENRQQLARFRYQARRRIELTFSLSRMLAQTEELFKSLGVAL